MINDLLRGKRGLWFYAGWIDQAVLHVGMVRNGGTELFSELILQIDDDQVDQGGDMFVCFYPVEEDWLFCVDVEPDRHGFSIKIRTKSDTSAQTIKELLQLEDHT